MSWITRHFKPEDFNSVKIKGKDYNTVAERIRVLGGKDLNYSKSSEYEVKEIGSETMFIVKCSVTINDGEQSESFDGLAQEVISTNSKTVNYVSALENAETSAFGRALASAGIGITEDFASGDEITRQAEAANRKIEANDEVVFQGLLQSGNQTMKDIVTQINAMCGSHEERIKLLHEITHKEPSATKKKQGVKGFRIENFSHLKDVMEWSFKNEQWETVFHEVSDRVNMAHIKYQADIGEYSQV